jgi:hypothetical protein
MRQLNQAVFLRNRLNLKGPMCRVLYLSSTQLKLWQQYPRQRMVRLGATRCLSAPCCIHLQMVPTKADASQSRVHTVK